jgi:hypothetical protein
MQLVYFQFRRLGLLIPFLFFGACVLAGYTKSWFGVAESDHFGFASLVSAIFAALSGVLRLGVNGLAPQKIYMELQEEWVVTKEVDEFMYMNLKQWAGCGIGGVVAFLIIRYFH